MLKTRSASSRAVHETYAKGALVVVPPLDEYESLAERKVIAIPRRVAGGGKSGGVRVIYLHLPEHSAIVRPTDLVAEVGALAAHYEGKKKLTLRTFAAAVPAPRFTAQAIVKLREACNLSRPVFAQILNVPPVTVRKWESGERKPSAAAL